MSDTISPYNMLTYSSPQQIYTIISNEYTPNTNTCDVPSPGQPNDWRINYKQTRVYPARFEATCARVPPSDPSLGTTVCPNISNNNRSPIVRWVSNDDQFTPYAPPGRVVQCEYKKSNFTIPNDVTIWRKIFLNPKLPQHILEHNQNVLDRELLPDLCLQPAGPGECRPDNGIVIQSESPCAGSTGVTGSGLTGCSRVNSIGPWSSICAGWAQSQNGNEFISRRMVEYCAATGNICSIDCRCINRGIVDGLYNELAALQPGQDGCWYAPCKNRQSYLVPNSIIVDPNACKPAACQIVVQAFNRGDGNININIGKATINCPGLNGNTGPVKPPGGDPLANIESIWEQYQVYILIGFAIFGILLFIIILYAVYDTKGEPNATNTTGVPSSDVIIPKGDPVIPTT